MNDIIEKHRLSEGNTQLLGIVNKNQLEVLELAAQTESLLNLYLQAKRELHMATGIVGVDVTKFPIVESVRAQIKAVRESK